MINYFELGPEGQIYLFGFCQEEVVHLVTPRFGGDIVTMWGETMLDIQPDEQYYDQTQGFVQRPAIDHFEGSVSANGVDEIFINFPAGTNVVIGEQSFVLEEDGLSLTTDTPGELVIKATPPFPYKPFEQRIIVNED